MIKIESNIIYIANEVLSMIIKIREDGKLELLHFGMPLPFRDAEALAVKPGTGWGGSVLYKEGDAASCLERIPLFYSESGRSDYRESPIEIFKDGKPLECDFVYSRTATSEDTLEIVCKCIGRELYLHHFITLYETVLTRSCVLENKSEEVFSIRKLAGAMFDIKGSLDMTFIGGGWIAEAHAESVPVGHARIVNESRYGFSSAVHNPAVMFAESGASEDAGSVWGINHVYSGNHYTSVQQSYQGLNRIVCGISPDNFEKELNPGESFKTPEILLTYSVYGKNGMSQNMHDFINNSLIPEYWRGRKRPVLFNSWEGYMFSFSEAKLISSAKTAAALGCELFVLDDGWFGARNNDKAGLGDYNVNTKKLPSGLKGLADKIRTLGLEFGIWFEPEAVNPDSDLYRTHPEWALHSEGLPNLYGRNELLLDLRKSEVRDYIVDNVSRIIDECGASYVKWDMNRQSPLSGAAAHDYIMGLEDVLQRIFKPRPEVLLESCASGGNRFDLQMLRFSPQIWASDNTDPIERLDIQGGYSLFYPQSTMGAHVSASPHAQTLRATALSTRGNVAFFGCLGYELDLAFLNEVERKEIKAQIEYYKTYRELFQFGRFRRNKAEEGAVSWQVSKGNKAVVGIFHRLLHAAPAYEYLYAQLDDEKNYNIEAKPQSLRIKSFGGLIKHVSPVALKPEGLILKLADDRYSMDDAAESFNCSGAALKNGVPLVNRFLGTGYSESMRMQSDFGSNIYFITEIKE